MTAAAGSGRQVSVDVLAERMEGVIRQITDLATKIDALTFVQPETYALQLHLDDQLRKEQERRLVLVEADIAGFKKLIEERRDRTWTTWVAPVVTAVVAAVILAIVLRGSP